MTSVLSLSLSTHFFDFCPLVTPLYPHPPSYNKMAAGCQDCSPTFPRVGLSRSAPLELSFSVSIPPTCSTSSHIACDSKLFSSILFLSLLTKHQLQLPTCMYPRRLTLNLSKVQAPLSSLNLFLLQISLFW